MNSQDASSSTSHELARKVTRGVGWNYLSYGLSKFISLAVVSILAHLLTPEHFGVVALATLAIEYISILNDFGLSTALIQRRENLEESANVVFTLNLSISLILTLVTILAAGQVAFFFQEPGLEPLLRWLGLSFTISALGSVHKARLQRDMRFRSKLVPELGNTIVKGVVSIGLAKFGFGAWSLVYGQLAGAVVSVILFWIVFPWLPRLTFSSNLTPQLFKYGISIMGDRALTIFGDSFDYFTIGLFFNTATLGIYTLAYRLPEMLVITTLNVLASVIFPAFASVQSQTDELRKSFLLAVRYIQLLITPLCLGLIVVADPVIRVAFGEQWLAAIPIMQILSLYALVLSVGYHVGDVYKAIGRPDILIKISIPIFVVRVIALWIGARHGLIGVALAHLAATTVELIVRIAVTTRVIKVSLVEIVKQLTAFIGGIFLLLTAAPVYVLTMDWEPLPRLIVISLAGAIGYIGAIWAVERDSLLNALHVIGLTPKRVKLNCGIEQSEL
jgi:O-antigen/teichoic acid export membrane protein